MGRRFDPDRAHNRDLIPMEGGKMRRVQLTRYGIPDFYVDPLAESKYGLGFWDSAETGNWESEQISDLTAFAKSGAFFIDVGASNGVYSLIMASLGCEVIAIEPDEAQFSAMKVNRDLNPELKIECRKGLIVSSARVALSPYALDLKTNNINSLEKIHFSSLLRMSDQSIVKIDIEGGEWALLRDKGVVKDLIRHNDLKLFLSPHIGFYSKDYHKGILYRLKFRISVLRELYTLYIFARKAISITYLGLKTTPLALLRQDRLFGGAGLRSHIIFEYSK